MTCEPHDTLTVLYDDRCPMCTFQSRLLSRLDWFGRITLLPLSDPTAHERAGQISDEQLREAIHCFDPTGRVFRGARALRHIGMRLPVMVPLALLLWVPGVILIAERVYRFVSRNRHMLSRWFGCAAACRVLPERKPDQHAPSNTEPQRERSLPTLYQSRSEEMPITPQQISPWTRTRVGGSWRIRAGALLVPQITIEGT